MKDHEKVKATKDEKNIFDWQTDGAWNIDFEDSRTDSPTNSPTNSPTDSPTAFSTGAPTQAHLTGTQNRQSTQKNNSSSKTQVNLTGTQNRQSTQKTNSSSNSSDVVNTTDVLIIENTKIFESDKASKKSLDVQNPPTYDEQVYERCTNFFHGNTTKTSYSFLADYVYEMLYEKQKNIITLLNFLEKKIEHETGLILLGCDDEKLTYNNANRNMQATSSQYRLVESLQNEIISESCQVLNPSTTQQCVVMHGKIRVYMESDYVQKNSIFEKETMRAIKESIANARKDDFVFGIKDLNYIRPLLPSDLLLLDTQHPSTFLTFVENRPHILLGTSASMLLLSFLILILSFFFVKRERKNYFNSFTPLDVLPMKNDPKPKEFDRPKDPSFFLDCSDEWISDKLWSANFSPTRSDVITAAPTPSPASSQSSPNAIPRDLKSEVNMINISTESNLSSDGKKCMNLSSKNKESGRNMINITTESRPWDEVSYLAENSLIQGENKIETEDNLILSMLAMNESEI